MTEDEAPVLPELEKGHPLQVILETLEAVVNGAIMPEALQKQVTGTTAMVNFIIPRFLRGVERQLIQPTPPAAVKEEDLV